MMRPVLLMLTCVSLLVSASVPSVEAGRPARHALYPDESVLTGYSKRLLAHFDASRVKNPERITHARLYLVGDLPAAVRIRTVTTRWGGLTAEFKARERRGVWTPEDLAKPGYKPARELFRLGDPDSEWASLGAKKWSKAGGDFGPVVADVRPGAEPPAADVTALVKSWAAEPDRNFGLVIALTDAPRGASLNRLTLRLVIEGEGVIIDDSLRLDDPPSWLPKTYKVPHPRLPYPTEAWLAALKADRGRMRGLRERADAFNPEKGRAADLGDLVLAQRLAPTPKRATLLSRAVDAPYPNHGGYSKCYGLAVLYDWGYDLLSPEDRRRLAYRLERMCTSEEIGSADTIISPYNDVGTSRFGCGALWAALAIYPDVPAARKHLWRAKAYYIDTSIPVWRQVMGDHGGYWHELHGYYLGTCLGQALARVLSVWTSATGEDLYRKNPWLEHMLYFGMYSTRPDLYRIRIGDIKCSQHYYGEDPISLYSFPALAKRYDNPYGRWWVERFGRAKLDGVTPTEWPWGEPFARNAKKRTWDSLPTVRHSDGVGVVNMRSDWSEDATYVWFKSGPHFWSHSHLDSGTFGIYKRGALAIDAGNYTAGHNCEHYLQYAKLSIAHNVITVTDPDEPVCKRGTWTFPNDGGQRFVAAGLAASAPYSVAEWNQRREEFDTGQIVAFQTTKDFTYVCADVTRAYTNAMSGTGDPAGRSKRVRKWIRSLVYLPPDHLVVFDQVESFNKAFKKRWLLHTINEPKADGDLLTVERADMAFRFSGWDRTLKHAVRAAKTHPFFNDHPDCLWYTGYQPQLYQYDGVMFVRTLLPREPEIVTVGGPGKECWFNGTNYVRDTRGRPITFRPHTGEGEAGRYRIEISPKAPAENDLFLNVIQVGAKSSNPTPTAARLTDVEGGTGVAVQLGDGKTAVIAFKDGVGGTVTIKQSGGTRRYELAERILPSKGVKP